MTKDAIDILKQERQNLILKIVKIDELLSLYDKSFISGNSDFLKKDGSLEPKLSEYSSADVLDFLRSENRLVRSSEILRKLSKNTDVGDMKRLSRVLSNLKTSRKINNFKETKSGVTAYWGLKEWFDDFGNPLEEYMKRED